MSTNYNLPSPANYDFWIKNNLNVLFIGKRGIGKTESVKEKFNEHFGDKWLYFSAPTMDPWVDFVGVPKEIKDESTGEHYLDLVRPRMLANDEVEAIFFDEYNRAKDKIRNAVMELIQFKSINGKKFKNLKIIWAAINPDDDDSYDVEKLDPAQRDRFQIHVHMPYVVNHEFFFKKYGPIGRTICTWWEKQDEAVREEISPRRLSYVLDVFNAGGELSYVLPYTANIDELVLQLTEGSFEEKLKALFQEKDDAKTREAFENENFVFGTEKKILSHQPYLEYFIPLFPKERIINYFINEEKVRTYFTSKLDYRNFQPIFDPILENYEKSKKVGSSAVQFSVISAIIRWKNHYIPATELSDAEFIRTVSDVRFNIEYLTKQEKRNNMINKFGIILNSGVKLEEELYHSMFGVCCELYHRVDDEVKAVLFKLFSWIKTSVDAHGYKSLDTVFDRKLNGLRQVKQSKELFEEVAKVLKEKNIISAKLKINYDEQAKAA